jgi:hypothetical protein
MDIDEALGVINIFGRAVEIAFEISGNKRNEAKAIFETNKTAEAGNAFNEAITKYSKCSKELLPFSKEKIRLAAKMLIDSGKFDDLKPLNNIEWLLNSFE